MVENINISIIGKPNVGKSTIFNKLLGSDISKVSSESGTTVFAITSRKEYKDLQLNLIDLGGLKRKSKSHSKNQKIITLETLNNLKLSDLVFFVLDASDEITKNDKQLFKLILNKLKNVIVLVNKVDLVKEKLKKKEDYFKFFFEKNYPNILIKPIFISANKNIKKEFLLKKVYEINYQSKQIIDNKKINYVLNEIVQNYQPKYLKNGRPVIKFIKHVNSKPMIFKVFGNRMTSLSKEYKNYFINSLLNKLNIFNRIVVIKYLNNNNPYSKKSKV